MMKATAGVQNRTLLIVFCCILLAGCSQDEQAGIPEQKPTTPPPAPSSQASITEQDSAATPSTSSIQPEPIHSEGTTESLALPTGIPDAATTTPALIPNMSMLELPDSATKSGLESIAPSIVSPTLSPNAGSKSAFSLPPDFNERKTPADRANPILTPPSLDSGTASRALPSDMKPATPSTPFSIAGPVATPSSDKTLSDAVPQSRPSAAIPPTGTFPNGSDVERRTFAMESPAARATVSETAADARLFEVNPDLSAASTAMPARNVEIARVQSSMESGMPVGTVATDAGYSKVQVYYGTDRKRSHVSLSAYELSGRKTSFMALGLLSLLSIAFAGISTLRSRSQAAGLSAMVGCLTGCMAVGLIFLGQTTIEKHGVNYTGERGQFTRGIAEVSVPDLHERGVVERPSLLRFEVREDQTKHIVLTEAVELLGDDFNLKIANAVATAPAHDLLVFIHGYNVSFESALLRTAQLAVDLPFEGVPVCYSWPSQATLTGYPIDANNADWTVPHLKDFLLELATETGADSINVIAHSMGNRAMTAAMRQISQQQDSAAPALFDRIVLAAPDIDADYFRRDAAPALVQVANHVTLYASSEDQALIASRKVNGYPRAGDSGADLVIAPGIETIDVSGTDMSLLGHSYYGDNEIMLRDLYDVVRARLPATQRTSLIQRALGPMTYWQLAQRTTAGNR
jgi:esterase/lipase superfamily enzyme